MRSEGLKMRWVRSPESTRRDSERTMSLFWDNSDSAPGDSGHLSMLLLRLIKNTRLAVEKWRRLKVKKQTQKRALTKCVWSAVPQFLGVRVVDSAGCSSLFFHRSPPLGPALPPNLEVCGSNWVSQEHKAQGHLQGWRKRSLEGAHQDSGGCVQ